MNVATENFPRPHRFTVADYYRMAEVGLLAPDARVELIEGTIFHTPPIESLCASVVSRLNRLLHDAVGDRAIVNCRLPVRLSDLSEPQPDFALLAPREDFYKRSHPTAADTLLLIEVSETTLRFDREAKMPLYAQHGVPEFWIFDTEDKQLHVFRNPGAGVYAETHSLRAPGVMPVTALPGVVLDLSSL